MLSRHGRGAGLTLALTLTLSIPLNLALTLTAQAFAWPALPALRRCAYDVLQAPDALPADLTLPDAKWARVRGSAYYARHPGARLLPPGALAQTLPLP